MKSPILNQVPILFTQNYKGERHRGVDIRSFDFIRFRLIPVICTEKMFIERVGIDGFGNNFMVGRPFDDTICTDIKYIHVNFNPEVIEGAILGEGFPLGITAIDSDYNPKRGNSFAHHLHFETWKGSKHIDPVNYFNYGEIPVIQKTSRA